MEIGIALAIAVLASALAFMGMYVTLHPPDTDSAKRNWKIGFGLVALLACAVTVWQTKRNSATQDALQKQLDRIRKNTENPPQVTVNVPPSPPPQVIVNEADHSIGSLSLAKVDFPPSLDTDPFAVNLQLVNVGQAPISGVYYWEIATFLPIGNVNSERDSNTADRSAYVSFLKLGRKGVADAKTAGHSPTYFAVGEDHWGTVRLRPRGEQIDGVITGTTRLYFFIYAEWDGGKSKYAACRWLQPPPEVHYGNGATLVLHDCRW